MLENRERIEAVEPPPFVRLRRSGAARAGGRSISRSDAVRATYEGFREGRQADVGQVRNWASAVARGGNWRFDDAEGVVQEILIRLLRIVRGGRIDDPESFQKFVYQVAKNTCVDIYHRERRRQRHETDGAALEVEPARGAIAGPEQDAEQRERYRLMLHIFQRLPEPCRQIWRWVYADGLAAAELAERLGISHNNARVRVHRCLEKARAIYEEQWAV